VGIIISRHQSILPACPVPFSRFRISCHRYQPYVRAIWGTPEKYFLHIYHKVSFRTSLCGEHVAGGTGNEMVVYKQARLLWLVTILYEQSQDGAGSSGNKTYVSVWPETSIYSLDNSYHRKLPFDLLPGVPEPDSTCSALRGRVRMQESPLEMVAERVKPVVVGAICALFLGSQLCEW
jgi:hypothetical protein